MTKLVSIAISLLILVQSFNIHFDDIVELDELIEHANFHSEEYGDNFFVFISKHYGELKAEHNQQHQEEKEDHEQLPFQHQYQSTSLSAFVLNNISDYPLSPETVVHHDANYFYQASYHSLAQEGLFQPPRLV
ncbi:hypothetical protein [Maribacter halichondriae]|uniref:hypothetical protein n=1 Tax=Maribacter halichondriae TaxID=2980554 RepID=UPI00235811EB|nr:hypothetical protein [Maribacter sp. Hal144]